MAKPIVVGWEGASSSFNLAKLDRTKLYGRRQRQVLDPEGERCERAELLRDGSLLVRSGMTAQGYFDNEDHWVPNNQLVGLDADDEPVDKVPSTLGVEQSLEGPIDPSEVFDLGARTVYMLTPEDLDEALQKRLEAGEFFRFALNYRADFNAETAILLHNANGFFALVGDPIESSWCELAVAAVDTFDDADDDEGDLDFEMF